MRRTSKTLVAITLILQNVEKFLETAEGQLSHGVTWERLPSAHELASAAKMLGKAQGMIEAANAFERKLPSRQYLQAQGTLSDYYSKSESLSRKVYDLANQVDAAPVRRNSRRRTSRRR